MECLSGWCYKDVRFRDVGLRTRRGCLSDPPLDHEGQKCVTVHTDGNQASRPIVACRCQGDRCNGASAMTTLGILAVVVSTAAVVILW